MKKLIVTLIVLFALAAVAAGAWLVDHLLSRADRLAATARQDAMITVRDQVLRYQWEHGVLPRSLDALVPSYVRLDQIVSDNAPLYAYDPAARTLSQAQASPVRGLRRRERPAVTMPLHEATEAPAAALTAADNALMLPTAPALRDAPAGVLVFEAEHWSEMNWGWEIHADGASGGGAYIHSWEGKTNGPAQLGHGVYNFYDVRPPAEYTSLKYRFHLDQRGTYYIYARLWTTDTHCSNAVSAIVDATQREEGNYLGNTDPFRWLWCAVQGSPFRLEAGDHYLNIFIHEDGLRIDQFVLSPARLYGDTGAWKENFTTGAGTSWQKSPGPPVHLSFDTKSEVLIPGTRPEINVTLRRLRAAEGPATLRVRLEAAGLGGRDWKVIERQIDLGALGELAWAPLSFDGLDVAALDRREYMLRAELLVDGKAVAEAHEALVRPFVWEALGPLDFLSNHQKGPFDASGEPDPRDTRKWKPVAETSLDHFGVLDFGVHTTGNSANAPTRVAIYARTRVRVGETGDYVLLIESDDAMVLWIDGKRVYEFEDSWGRPVTRSASRRKVRLDAGDHELRMRVNQTERFWQATVRVRNADEGISNVTGLPLR